MSKHQDNVTMQLTP